jgi:hypothetical protein
MNRIGCNHRIRRPVSILACLASALLISLAAAPAAFASASPGRARVLAWADPPLWRGWGKHPTLPTLTHTAVTGGTPGWQITLIAAGAAILATALAVALHRAWGAARRQVTSTAS